MIKAISKGLSSLIVKEVDRLGVIVSNLPKQKDSVLFSSTDMRGVPSKRDLLYRITEDTNLFIIIIFIGPAILCLRSN